MRKSDDELWAAVARGDADSFGELFERHGRTVSNYCFRRTGNWTRAQDLTSVVFLECWRRRTKSVDEGKVLPWFLGVATNVCRNESRSLARHRAALLRMPPPEVVADVADETLDRLSDETQMAALLQMVARLPKREQDVLALCVWSQMSYEDAANALGIPIGTVRSRLARARIRLRAQTDRQGGRVPDTNRVPAARPIPMRSEER